MLKNLKNNLEGIACEIVFSGILALIGLGLCFIFGVGR